ncbi:MAG: TrmB family transcriptional regulator [Candidatus Hermodarchaeia archaeon]|jgi:sugar-specific transcriptional regulator TrmB
MGERMDEGTTRVLRNLGLSSYEARVYISLVRNGALTASEVSSQSRIPFSRVYDVLAALDRGGWITIEQGRPKRYVPKSPRETAKAAVLSAQDRLAEWEHRVIENLQPLFDEKTKISAPEVHILHGSNNVRAKLNVALGQAERNVLLSWGIISEEDIEFISPTLLHLRDRGVKIQILVSEQTLSEKVERLISAVGEGRKRKEIYGGGAVIDEKQAIIMLTAKPTESLAIWTRHTELSELAKIYFLYLYQSAEPLS